LCIYYLEGGLKLKQNYKILIAILLTSLLLLLLWFDIPSYLSNKYYPKETHRVSNWKSSIQYENVERIILNGKYLDPKISIEIDFRYLFNKAYPNLFQTSNHNEGLRLEFSGNNAAIIYKCKGSSCPPSGYNVFDLTKNLNVDKDNFIYISLLQDKYLKIQVNSSPPNIIRNPPPNINYDNILIGNGFDGNRVFSGNINTFNFTINSNSYLSKVKIVFYCIVFLIYFLGIFSLKRVPTF
jgi:hypothetical protein